MKSYRPPPAYSMAQTHSKESMGYIKYAAEEAILDAVDRGISAVEVLKL
ncbi:MAG: hypothetical protein PHN69_03925 [Candidatus Pacebacteria bacterium]|nr:hypothetical protein [Candidatus Paceibacterota bacterium]